MFHFQASNADHLRTVYDMGITMVALGEGRVQLLHSFYNAKSPEDAEKGLLFMQEMVELSKNQATTSVAQMQAVYFIHEESNIILKAGPSHFSPELTGDKFIKQNAVYTKPSKLCSSMCFVMHE